jgi:autotransporter strand-loop-strand O-heptosyltransferase
MITYNIHHIKGLYFQITGDEGKNREYDVTFVDRETNKELYKLKMKVGHWAQLARKYLSDVSVFVRYEGRTIKQVNFLEHMRGKRVFISFESKALGDTLAWMPYCREFAKHYECKVIVSTFKNFMFEKTYPDLEFVDRGVIVKDLAAMIEIGWYWDKEKEPVNPILIPLQQSATNILKLPYQEIQPDIDFTPAERPVPEKYVCISMYSTSQCKLWYYWQDVIDFLNEKGYKVFEISKESDMMYQKTSDLNGIIEMKDKSFENTMNYLSHCDFYIGLSSGLSWLAWGLRKRVYMISNFTNKEHEFNINTIRITDENICNGCWHDEKFRFDKSNWMWCPRHEDTPRHFECHKKITAETVINKIKENEGI